MDDVLEARRSAMIEEQLVGRGVLDLRVLEAMSAIPRHLFVPESQKAYAYEDHPLPIGFGQTISQPYMVARMLEELELRGDERVLEVGTGSGYQAALLGRLVRHVWTVEIVPELARSAREAIESIGMENVEVILGDGTMGWPRAAPFDAIVVAAAAPVIPSALIAQLSDPGRLVIPVGDRVHQTLLIVTKKHGLLDTRAHGGCAFVPLIGREGWSDVPLPEGL